ncbi:NAD(P)/FAD-dependent oxidoreductase [Polyangium jinanense]|uniref:NAD(P)/FAD-dependent oxidoreductase n=1 Tax=Polyangium jinanense TaxID=2829994 RepID=UPI0023406BB0|nr:NAD(P)/FAD-dependent oxidoreductase [Polyangium jinanense]MDC3962951.1 NAD(P)/FAD-dependent oxidoreductase [Polyangium jinanense]
MPYDALIIGGGPAGLTAALYLGRARKRVLVCDAGPARNAAAHEVHGFTTRDGIPPAEFRRAAWADLEPYGVTRREARVHAIERVREGGFRARLEGGETVEARRILLALGVVDVLRDLPGYAELWGESIFICPYCHGFEVRDQAWGLVAQGEHMVEHALFFRGWSRDLVVFLDGAPAPPPAVAERLERAGIRVEPRPLRALHGAAGKLEAVELADGTRIPRDVLFVRPTQRQTPLVESLGLALNEHGYVQVNELFETSVPGIHAAGDLTTMMQGAILAAADGARAANALNRAITLEDAER